MTPVLNIIIQQSKEYMVGLIIEANSTINFTNITNCDSEVIEILKLTLEEQKNWKFVNSIDGMKSIIKKTVKSNIMSIKFRDPRLNIDEFTIFPPAKELIILWNNCGVLLPESIKQLEYFQKALSLYEKICMKDYEMISVLYNNYAIADIKKRKKYLEEAFKIINKNNIRTINAAIIYYNMGIALSNKGQYLKKAIELFDFNKIDNIMKAKAYFHIAEIYKTRKHKKYYKL